MMGSRRRCVLFFYEGYLGVAPSIINLSKAFATAGYDVTIYSIPTSTPAAGDIGNVSVRLLEPSRLGRLLGEVGFGRFRIGAIARRLVRLTPIVLFSMRALSAEMRSSARRKARTVYVGIDMDAVLTAVLCATIFRSGYLYLSLELPPMNPAQGHGVRSALVRLAYRRSAASLTQGPDRLAMMNRDFRWSHPKVFILPNAPFAENANATGEPLLRGALNIPRTRRIALQAGMIDPKACSIPLARGFVGASDWALVLHERVKRSRDEAYIVELSAANRENLYLSLDPVPYDQIDRVFESADVGLVFYEPGGPDDDDFRFISSSGKLTHCLKHGKPLLVSDLPPLVEIVREYDCGIVIHDPSDAAEIGRALAQISDRYAELSRNARHCFSERYDFGQAVAPVIQFADGLC